MVIQAAWRGVRTRRAYRADLSAICRVQAQVNRARLADCMCKLPSRFLAGIYACSTYASRTAW